MITETFGRMLRRRRKDAQLSLRELGKLVDLNWTYLSKIENDKLPAPSLRAIKRLASVLCADIEDMASFAEPSKQYMARLDKLQEEIGELHKTIAQYRDEVGYWRNRAINRPGGLAT